ncbi:hypothetical protein LCGC14_1322560 [marine sediment metagenome]|uniref:Uncharacterized protein n=1 Tax=marine sediment metagenome TaxID=412755 RepID=A0A0F9L4J9_9ZZZZ
MPELDDGVLLNIGDAQVSLAQLAGIPMDDVEEVRRFVFPAMIARWRVEGAKLTIFGAGDKKEAAVQMEFKCREPLKFVDQTDESKADKLVGKKHSEAFLFRGDPMETIGRVKAFMSDCGFRGTGQLQELLNGFQGYEFKGKLTITSSANDPDRKFNNLGLNFGEWKVSPVATPEAEPATATG